MNNLITQAAATPPRQFTKKRKDFSPIPPGTKIGAWVVIADAPHKYGSHSKYLCICECGTQRAVLKKHLRNGRSVSCGCVSYRAHSLVFGMAAKNHLLSSRKHSARHRGYVWAISDGLFYELCAGNCRYCGCPPSREHRYKMTGGNGTFLFNGIDRLDNSKGYVAGNVASCCYVCNRAKQSMGEAEFLAWVSKVYAFRVQPPVEFLVRTK